MAKLAKVLTLFACLIVVASAVEFQCEFKTYKKWFVYETFYDCDINGGSFNNDGDRVVTSASGDHEVGKSNSDVQSLSLDGRKNVKFSKLPKEIEKFFTDLIVMDIYKIGLKEVNAEDLKPFSNLRYLSFASNKIEHLEPNLFSNNPKLELLMLIDNKINSAANAFENLPNLRYLDIKDNVCHSEFVQSDKSKVQQLIQKINQNCPTDYKEAYEQCSRELKSSKVYKTESGGHVFVTFQNNYMKP